MQDKLDQLWVELQPRLRMSNPEVQLLIAPIVAYWSLSGFYELLPHLAPGLQKYRLYTQAQEDKCNLVSKGHVAVRVLLQHFVQTVLAVTLMAVDPGMCGRDAIRAESGWLGVAVSCVLGMLVMDSWQYFIHRTAHEVKFLYKHVHSHHHRLLVPYAFGALYNHPLEALLLDSLGAMVTMYAANMSCTVATPFMALATSKTVFDHCGYVWPVNPVHNLFANNARYHNVHHDLRGLRKNYSQPFFTIWDHLLGTYLSPDDLARRGGEAATGAKAVKEQ